MTIAMRTCGAWALVTGVLLLAPALCVPVGAQVLDDEGRLSITLDDGTEVNLVRQVGTERAPKYYYLPTNLRLSQKTDGTPQFLFLKYTTEATEAQGGVQGGLIHFLMEWGLTAKQEKDLDAKVKKLNRNAKVMGAVPLEHDEQNPGFEITSATLKDTGEGGLTRTLVTSGKAPLMEGGKAAVAARLTRYGAETLAATFEKTSSITDVSITLNYNYTVQVQGAKGTITFHWDKLQRDYDSLNAEYKKIQTGTNRKVIKVFGITIYERSSPEYTYSYDEMREQYKLLEDHQIIEMKFEEGRVASDKIDKIREVFFQYFLNSMAQPDQSGQSEALPPSAESEEGGDKSVPEDVRGGKNYHYNQTSIQQAFSQGSRSMSLDYRMAYRQPVQLTGNLTSWYNAVRDNPRCVASVNLNDPFFQHRDIRFILDLDAKDIFDEAVNYVTVNVRKQRNAGRPFEDHVTIDAKYLADNGLTAVVTYARGNDSNPDLYEYQTQWSLRGGHIFPADPPWTKGSWEGVTLAPPVMPRKIELEGDLDELKASDIARVTAQIRYYQFGQEAEANIHLSASQDDPLSSQRIFTDRNSRGYAYRLIFNHKRQGKFATPWEAKINDDYVYATIPEDLLEKPEYKEAAARITETATERVLDRFAELLGGDK
jgi:hypothetical protein